MALDGMFVVELEVLVPDLAMPGTTLTWLAW